jgi:hypothetical protein
MCAASGPGVLTARVDESRAHAQHAARHRVRAEEEDQVAGGEREALRAAVRLQAT